MKEEEKISLQNLDEKVAFIEAILFVSKETVEPERLMDYLNCQDIEEFEKIITHANAQFIKIHRGVMLKRSGGGFQLTTKPDMHELLKDFLKTYRPELEMDHVANGEHWFGTDALELKLIDELRTSDAYLLEASTNADLYEVTYPAKKKHWRAQLIGLASRLAAR